jgi:peptide/nickel transport system permease protein
MSGYIARRLLGVVINLMVVSFFIFFSMRLVPGDLTMIILTERSTEEQRDAFREEHGLDKPQLEQYLSWAANVIRGDFGKSYRTGIPVAEEFKSRAPITLEVALLSFTFTSILGVAARRRWRPDRCNQAGYDVGLCRPNYGNRRHFDTQLLDAHALADDSVVTL